MLLFCFIIINNNNINNNFNRGNIGGTNSSQIYVCSLCIHICFVLCLCRDWFCGSTWENKLKCIFAYDRLWLSWGDCAADGTLKFNYLLTSVFHRTWRWRLTFRSVWRTASMRWSTCSPTPPFCCWGAAARARRRAASTASGPASSLTGPRPGRWTTIPGCPGLSTTPLRMMRVRTLCVCVWGGGVGGRNCPGLSTTSLRMMRVRTLYVCVCGGGVGGRNCPGLSTTPLRMMRVGEDLCGGGGGGGLGGEVYYWYTEMCRPGWVKMYQAT